MLYKGFTKLLQGTNIGKTSSNLSLLQNRYDLPSIKEFLDQHLIYIEQGIDSKQMITKNFDTINIAKKVFNKISDEENSTFLEQNILERPNINKEASGSMKILISDIVDYPIFEEIYNKHLPFNTMLCIGGPASEDQVVMANIISNIQDKLDDIIYLTRDYKESNVNHSAKQSHARHGNALNADEELTGHALLPMFIIRKLLGVKIDEILEPDYKKIDLKFEFDFRKLRIYFNNELNWLRQEYKKKTGKLTEHDINRLESVLSQEILKIVENQAGLEISGNKHKVRDDTSAIHVTFTPKNDTELQHENNEFEKVGIKSFKLDLNEQSYFFPHNSNIFSSYKYPGDTHLKFDTHEINQRFAVKNGVKWIENEQVVRIFVKKNSVGNAEVVGALTLKNKFILATKIHITGGYMVAYEFDKQSKRRFNSSLIRNFINYFEDRLDLQKPLNNDLTVATGVSINLILINTPEIKKILEKHKGFEFAVTNSHWTPIAWDNDHIIVRATGGGNTGSEEYNPTFLINVLANTRRIFGDAFIGVLSSYGCPRSINAKNSTEFAKIAEGLIISYGKGGTGNTKRHAEAAFALMELGFKDEILNYFNQFQTNKGKMMGNEILNIYEESNKCFFHNNLTKTNYRMGYKSDISIKEVFIGIVAALLIGSFTYRCYIMKQNEKYGKQDQSLSI